MHEREFLRLKSSKVLGGKFWVLQIFFNSMICLVILAPKPNGRRSRKPGIDRKPRQAYSAKQLERLEAEFKVIFE